MDLWIDGRRGTILDAQVRLPYAFLPSQELIPLRIPVENVLWEPNGNILKF